MCCVALRRPVTNEAEFKLCLKMTEEVLHGNEVLERDGNWLIEATGFGEAEHGRLQGEKMISRRTVPGVNVWPFDLGRGAILRAHPQG